VACSAALIVVLISFLLPNSWFDDHDRRHRHGHHHDLDEPWQPIGNHPIKFSEQGLKKGALKKILLETPDTDRIRDYSRYYTEGPHLAGKNKSQAEYTRDLWKSFGVDSEIVSYDIYLNYPTGDTRVALLRSQSDGGQELAYEASLKEDILEEDPTTGLPDQVPVFHGYSASGNVTAQYVYVNFGTYHDFADLQAAGVELKGKIALVKYGRCFRGLKVMIAEELGMAGVIMYDDPQEDGDITELNGYKAYPDGWARNPSAVQRGSVQYLSFGPGDPTTIGYPSKPGVPRTSPNKTTPGIPSLPISYKDALPLLTALNGHGLSSKDPQFNEYWQGGGLEHLGVEYNIGPSPPELTINLINNVDYEITPIWDVIGIVNGTGYKDETVLVGNHRDAWITGGAGDPNSGSSTLNEVVRSFGKALDAGWKPQRTLVFASWDGEEYGLLGSTEWVEEFVPWLKESAIAYLNVDVAASGPQFHASAAPLLNRVLTYATAQVLSPNQTVDGQTVFDAWEEFGGASISTLGSGSDYTAFQDFAGVSSLDFGFKPIGRNSPVYHYHSNYDSEHWMEKYGDPGFKYHQALARVLGIMTAAIADQPVIPFRASDYAKGLKSYLKAAEKKFAEKSTAFNAQAEPAFSSLAKLIDDLRSASLALDRKAAVLRLRVVESPSWWNKLRGRYLRREIAKVNKAYKLLERAFLYEGGLDNREFYKHVVFAPGKFTGYAGVTFPGITENIDDGNPVAVAKWAQIIAGCLMTAVKVVNDADVYSW